MGKDEVEDALLDRVFPTIEHRLAFADAAERIADKPAVVGMMVSAFFQPKPQRSIEDQDAYNRYSTNMRAALRALAERCKI